jgi:hypothetical protein
MPYQPYDTGWIKSIYGGLCLAWLLCTNSSLPHLKYEIYSICYDNICIPIIELFNKLFHMIGNTIISFGEQIVKYESIIFHHFNYIDPIFNGFKLMGSIFNTISVDIGPPSFHCCCSNLRRHCTSSGRHVCSYYARKHRLSRQQIIVPGLSYYKSKNDNMKTRAPFNYNSNQDCDCSDYIHTFHPFNDNSHCGISCYDAISPYWTEGMIWNGAYVLGHQVVSVTTDPIFVTGLLPGHELSATIQASEVRSEGEHVGLRTTIALDSGSSIHIFKDAFLLDNIQADHNLSINVRTTDSKFRISDIGQLCDDLKLLPLPSDGYYFYPNGVANILSLAMIAETERVVMDTAIDNAFYVFNEDGIYIRFSRTANGMYCIDINKDEDDHVIMAHQTVEGESAQFSAIDCRRASKIREL